MTLTFVYNCNKSHYGLASLFLFGSASCLIFVIILSRSCYSSAIASTFIVVILGLYLRLEDLRRRSRLPSSAEAPCNNHHYTKNKWLVMFFRTFGRGRPQQSLSYLISRNFKDILIVQHLRHWHRLPSADISLVSSFIVLHGSTVSRLSVAITPHDMSLSIRPSLCLMLFKTIPTRHVPRALPSLLW
jgi:hypothetical protein